MEAASALPYRMSCPQVVQLPSYITYRGPQRQLSVDKFLNTGIEFFMIMIAPVFYHFSFLVFLFKILRIYLQIMKTYICLASCRKTASNIPCLLCTSVYIYVTACTYTTVNCNQKLTFSDDKRVSEKKHLIYKCCPTSKMPSDFYTAFLLYDPDIVYYAFCKV